MLTVVSGGSFYKGLDNKIIGFSIFNSSDNRFFLQFKIHISLHTRFRFTK